MTQLYMFQNNLHCIYIHPFQKCCYTGNIKLFLFFQRAYLKSYPGANRFYYLCLKDALAFGGGGSFALCVDEDL
jgi:hypothetical protein